MDREKSVTMLPNKPVFSSIPGGQPGKDWSGKAISVHSMTNQR